MKLKFLIIIVIALIFSISCKSKHSNTSDEDILSDSDILNDSDISLDYDISVDEDTDFASDSDLTDETPADNDIADTEPDETADENDSDLTDHDTADIDITDEEIPDPDTSDEITTDTDTTDDAQADDDTATVDTDITDEDTADPDIIPFDEDYMTDDEITANCTDGICDIPSGEFSMGCAPSDTDCSSNENPAHSVILSSFRIMKNEVTVSEYQSCVDSGNCNNNNAGLLHYAVWSNTVNYEYCNLGSSRDTSQPMNCVSWHGAKAYCEWLGMRLPTEAEWEYAARGNDDRIFPWGNTSATCDYAVMKENGELGCGEGISWIVGSKSAGDSPFGLSDMAGNIREWCNDWYSSNYYSISPQVNPTGPENGSFRVLKGGSWYRGAADLRTSSRYYSSPAGNLLDSYGFRCAAD